MLSNLRIILSMGLGAAVWVVTIGASQAQFGGLQIQIGGSPFDVGPSGGAGFYGNGQYNGGFGIPFGVGPSIPPSSRAYMSPQHQSGYRGYYNGFGVEPSLGVYGSPLDYQSPTYRNYGYLNRSSLDQLQVQQYTLQRQQLELQAAQRRLSAQQSIPYHLQSRNSVQTLRGSISTSDLRPGMVLSDGSTVISVGPISPTSASTQQSGAKQSTVVQPTVQPNILPSASSELKKAAF